MTRDPVVLERRELKSLQRMMIRAACIARRDPTPANTDRAVRAALAYDRARSGWSR